MYRGRGCIRNSVLPKHSGSAVKNPPAMQKPQEILGQSLHQEDPLEKRMATLSSILARKTPWTEEPAGLQSTVKVKVKVAQSCLTLCNPMDYTYIQSMEFSRPEY